MFSDEELSKRLYEILDNNAIDKTPEIEAKIESLVLKAKDSGLNSYDYVGNYRQVEAVFKDYLRIKIVRQSAVNNVTRWLNTAEDILRTITDYNPDADLLSRIEIAKMLQLDEIRNDK
jgi:hypothetical protein